MGFIGGFPAYWFLKNRYPGGEGVAMAQGDDYALRGIDKLATLFGPSIYEELKARVVLDFGCGTGECAVELARRGCERVTGLDIVERHLAEGRRLAEKADVADRVEFATQCNEAVDVVLSTDAFEHFADPAEVLEQISQLLRPGGYALIEFGYPWHHPLGGHLFSVFPWAHLIFTESALIRWRSDFKTDGATRFGEVEGGLNQMTLKRWERYVEQSPLRFATYELQPIRVARWFHSEWTREWLTSIVVAKLVKRA